MEKRKMKITIKKVKDPSCFWGVNNDLWINSDFKKKEEEITSYFGDEKLYKALLSNPHAGQKCVVLYSSSWHRGCVETVVVTHRGCRVRCFLVDMITTVLVPPSRVYVSPSWVWSVPSLGTKFALHGVVPLGLQTDYEKDKVQIKSFTKWDACTVEYFSNLINKAHGDANVEVMKTGDDGIHFVQLYIQAKATSIFVCVNEVLVQEKYAGLKSEYENKVEKHHAIISEASKTSYKKHAFQNHLIKPKEEILQNMRFDNKTEMVEENIRTGANKLTGFNNIRKNMKSASNHFSTLACEKSSRERSSRLFDAPNLSPHSTDDCGDVSRRSYAREEVSRSLNDSTSADFISKSSAIQDSLTYLPDLKNVCQEQIIPKQEVGKNESVSAGHEKPSAILVKTRENRDKESNANKCDDSSDLLMEIDEALASPASSKVLKESYPGKMSPLERKVLLLEKMLNDAKEQKESNKTTLPPNGVGRGLCLSLSRSNVNDLSPKIRMGEKNEDDILNAKESIARSKPQTVSQPLKQEDAFYVSKTIFSDGCRTLGTILVNGINPPNPIALFCDAPFPPFVIQAIEEQLRYRGPYLIQAHTWPAILAGRNLMAIAPSGQGKTLAFVAPLVTMLLRKGKRLPDSEELNPIQTSFIKSSSPIVIVLCSSWKNVHLVEEHFKLFLDNAPQSRKSCPRHRVIGIIGGPTAEEAQAVNLITGSSVLVCSPYTLIRICKKKYIDLSRVEKIVLDDIHILAEEFTPQIRQIMKSWSDVLNDPDRPPLPDFRPQILGFGTQWTAGVDSFIKTFMKKTLLYISHPLEAAVYGGVQHQVEVFSQSSKVGHLLAMLISMKKTRVGGIGVFVKTAKTAKTLVSALKSKSLFCVEAYSSMPEFELQEIQKSFEEDPASAPILVACDDVLSILGVETIEYAIQYEFPKNWYQLGLRLFSMKENFNISKQDSKTKTVPRSCILLTEENIGESPKLVKFLSRLSQNISPQLQQLALAAIESKEMDNFKRSLCPHLQAYGKCMDVNACNYRHFLSEKLDAPNQDATFAQVPQSGQVQLVITSIVNASYFYGRLLRRRSELEATFTYPSIFDEICHSLKKFYSSEKNCISLELEPKPGDLVGVRIFSQHNSSQFYRARAIADQPFSPNHTKTWWTTPGGVIKMKVQLVDTGAYHTFNINDILQLPEHFSRHPHQAIRIRACSIRPIDHDLQWLLGATELVHSKLYEKEVEGNVVLALNHTIWLQPVVIRTKLPRSGIYRTECNIINELLASGLAEKNPDHLKQLLLRCEGKDILSDVVSNKKAMSTDDVTIDKTDSNLLTSRLENSLVIRNDSQMESMTISSDNNLECSSDDNSCSSTSSEDPMMPPLIICKPSPVPLKSDSENLQEMIFSDPEIIAIRSQSSESRDEDGRLISDIDVTLGKDVKSDKRNELTVNTDLVDVNKAKLPITASGINGKLIVDKLGKPYSPRAPPDARVRRVTTNKQMISPAMHPRACDSNAFAAIADKTSSRDSVTSAVASSTVKISRCLETDRKKSIGKGMLKKQMNNGWPTRQNKKTFERRVDSSFRSPALHKKGSALKLKSGSNSKKNRTPPPMKKASRVQDVSSNSLLCTFHKLLLQCDDDTKRIESCQDLYLTCSEGYSYFTGDDVKELYGCFLATRNDKERLLISASLLSLALPGISIAEHISITDMIQLCCLGDHENSYNLPHTVLTLCSKILEDFLKDCHQETVKLSQLLVSYLSQITRCEGMDEAKIMPVIQRMLYLMNKIFTVSNQATLAVKEDLIDVLTRIKPNTKTDEFRKSLFLQLLSCCEDDGGDDSSETSTVEHPLEKLEVPKPEKKVYDSLNYDRFNAIDTDSDTASLSQAYTPITIKYDPDTETAVSESDSDAESLFLQGM